MIELVDRFADAVSTPDADRLTKLVTEHLQQSIIGASYDPAMVVSSSTVRFHPVTLISDGWDARDAPPFDPWQCLGSIRRSVQNILRTYSATHYGNIRIVVYTMDPQQGYRTLRTYFSATSDQMPDDTVYSAHVKRIWKEKYGSNDDDDDDDEASDEYM